MESLVTTRSTLLTALGGWLSYLARRAGGPAVAATAPPPHPAAAISSFDDLQHVLRLAAECPAGPAGDDIRRAACELIEANSDRARHTSLRRMRSAIAAVELRRSRGQSRVDDPGPVLVGHLTHALRGC